MPKFLQMLANQQFLAALKPLLMALAGAAIALGFISASDSENIVAALLEIGKSIGQISAALMLIYPIIQSIWDARQASPTQQIKNVQAIADSGSVKSDSAKTALVNATASIASDPVAPQSEAAKVAILGAAATVPEVENIKAPTLHQEVLSEKVTQ